MIPLRLRQRLQLTVGDQLDLDETAPVLIARRVVDRREWEKTIKAWHAESANSLKGHPWLDSPSSAIIDDLRGGPAEVIPKRKKR